MQPIKGLHHITAVAGDPQGNINFYRQVLGQRLVKTTVNFDDPGTYHFYYGDRIGTPGTLLTFFPWRHVKPGRAGSGEATAVAYSIPQGSLNFWQAHLERMHANPGEVEERFGAAVLPFEDPDGMRLELIVSDQPAAVQYWQAGPIPEPYALRGFHSTTLWLTEIEPTAELLSKQLGYQLVGQEGLRYRFKCTSAEAGLFIDLLHQPGYPLGRFGAGSIHHIAFRVGDEHEQLEYLNHLRQAGQRVTPVQDRQYFRSIYFRSPGGVLFEIATDSPGMTIDEPVGELGDNLKLPPWLEANRNHIENILPKIVRPSLINSPELIPVDG